MKKKVKLDAWAVVWPDGDTTLHHGNDRALTVAQHVKGLLPNPIRLVPADPYKDRIYKAAIRLYRSSKEDFGVRTRDVLRAVDAALAAKDKR